MNKAGWFVAVFLSGVLFTFAWQVGNPVEQAHDHIAQPAAVALGIVSENPCQTIRAGDAVVRYCQRDGWTVWLTASGDFDYAWDGESPEFVTDPSQVPGWPW